MNVGTHSSLLSGYTELRMQRNTNRFVALVNGNVTTNTSRTRGGVSARVYDRGAWGFASDADTRRAGVERVIDTARRNAGYLARRADKGLGPLPVTAGSSENVFVTTKNRWSNAETIDFIQGLDAWVAETFPELKSRALVLANLDMHKDLITSEGSHAHSLIPRTLLVLRLTMVRDGVPFTLSDFHGGFGQVEDHFTDPAVLASIQSAVGRQVEHLARKTEAVYATAGAHTCVLDADLAGILAHEAIGHTTEGDLVLGGSVAGDNLGKPVASELVSLTDFANTAFGQRLPVPVYVDDEGTEAKDVPIITDGVLQNFMHTKETALRMGHAPTGNARAYQFDDEPLVRMRNTSFLPGTSKLEEMIASVDDGYYLMRSSNGQADATSEFMFGVVLGYEIKNGKLGRAIRDTTISGVAFDVLKTVTMVSDDINWQSAGMCGKKQPIPVGMGGPAIKCTVNLGGQ